MIIILLLNIMMIMIIGGEPGEMAAMKETPDARGEPTAGSVLAQLPCNVCFTVPQGESEKEVIFNGLRSCLNVTQTNIISVGPPFSDTPLSRDSEPLRLLVGAKDRHRLNGYSAQRVHSPFPRRHFWELFELCSSERYVSLED